jgi:hypothetical protein
LDGFLDALFLRLADEARRIGRRHGFFLHHLIRLLQLRRRLVRIDPKRETNRIRKDVVLETKLVVQNVPATAPAVFFLIGHAEFGDLEGMFGKFFQQRLIYRLGLLADHREAFKRHRPGRKSHGSVRFLKQTSNRIRTTGGNGSPGKPNRQRRRWVANNLHARYPQARVAITFANTKRTAAQGSI